MTPLFPVTLALYALACGLYLSHASGAGERIERFARLSLLAAFLSHAVDIGMLCIAGSHPFANAREALSFIAWLTVGAYLLVTLRYKVAMLGALLVPVTMVLDVAARMAPMAPGHAESLLTKLHIGLATAGVALFAVAAGDSAVFLAAETQLKRHKKKLLSRPGPALETLDRVNRVCILVGFPLFTVAMVMGALIAMHQPGGAERLVAPEYLLSAVTWVLYAALLVARRTAGWRGRRAALVTLAGFGAAACVLAIYYAHTFQGRV